MKTFEVILTIEASDCTTEKDVQKSLEFNSSHIEFDLIEGCLLYTSDAADEH